MSNSPRRIEKRRQRAKQREYENRMKRNALRNKHRVVREKPVSLEVIKEERKRRKSLWQKLKDFYNQQVRVKLRK